MEYIINVELNGKRYKVIKSKKDFNWGKLEEVESEIKDKYKGQRPLSSCQGGDHGYYVGLQEEEGVAFCYRYKTIHVTDFVDTDGKKICLNDKLIRNFDRNHEKPVVFEILHSGWVKDEFYIRTYFTELGKGLCWRDIRNVTQETINDYEFIKYEENTKKG